MRIAERNPIFKCGLQSEIPFSDTSPFKMSPFRARPISVNFGGVGAWQPNTRYPPISRNTLSRQYSRGGFTPILPCFHVVSRKYRLRYHFRGGALHLHKSMLSKVEKRLTSYRDSGPRAPKFLEKKKQLFFPGPNPKFLKKFKKILKKPETTFSQVFSGAFLYFLSFLKECGVGPWGGIFRFFRGISGLGVLNTCGWSGVSQL